MSEASRIHIVSASAGTGKTYRLGTELRDALLGGTPPEKVLATTFTNRAAAELLERGRWRLLEEKRPDLALRLMLARIGTVNSVFGQMVGDFALDQGRSPAAAVVADAAQKRLFRIAADGAIGRHAAELERLAERFGFGEGLAEYRVDWRKMLGDIVGAARLNGIGPEDLGTSRDRSWSGLKDALGAPEGDAKALDGALRDACGTALHTLGDGDERDVTTKAIEVLREAEGLFERSGALPWSQWVKLSKLKASRALDSAVAPVRAAASTHAGHPRLHEDLERFIRTMFKAAEEAMAQTIDYKRSRGLVDFVDQEAEALALLSDPDVAARIAAETDLLLVDEFQDTSPIQLALFMRLARLVPRTLFVGDPKQAIYGFRGADPQLVEEVAKAIARNTGSGPETLSENRRSRPELVEFANAVFETAFPPLGIAAEQVTVTALREDAPGQDAPLHLWRVLGSNAESATQALAARIAQLLEDRDAWLVAPRGEQGRTRPLAGGDIAVLALTNRHAEAIARALAGAGIKVALERDGLAGRAECVVALAGLRVLADPSDTLAIAEILHILEGDAEAPAWLEAALASEDPSMTLRDRGPIPALITACEGLATITPAEALDRAIDVLDLPAWLPRWGETASRHANLEALRALAREYEDECRQERLPGTAAGLGAWISARDALTQPASPDPDAVHVLSVHRSKGLEWPVVILPDLDDDDEPRLFNSPVAMARDGALDPSAPLDGRWIRLWPWPYGAQKAGIPLVATADASPEGVAARAALKAERARLLYVALTRARDYLVLAPRVSVSARGARALKAGWPDLFPDALALPGTGDEVRAGGRPFAFVVEDVGGDLEPEAGDIDWAPSIPEGQPPAFAARRESPSAAVPAGDVPFRVLEIGPRLPLAGRADMRLVGEAVHGFFAADRPTAALSWRQALAERLLAAWGVSQVASGDLVAAADRFWSHLDEAFPGARHLRELPVVQFVDGTVTSGRADLVLEHADGLALYDHKTFPGGAEAWPREVASYAPQLDAYAGILSRAAKRGVTRRAIHLAVAGVVLLVGEAPDGAG